MTTLNNLIKTASEKELQDLLTDFTQEKISSAIIEEIVKTAGISGKESIEDIAQITNMLMDEFVLKYAAEGETQEPFYSGTSQEGPIQGLSPEQSLANEQSALVTKKQKEEEEDRAKQKAKDKKSKPKTNEDMFSLIEWLQFWFGEAALGYDDAKDKTVKITPSNLTSSSIFFDEGKNYLNQMKEFMALYKERHGLAEKSEEELNPDAIVEPGSASTKMTKKEYGQQERERDIEILIQSNDRDQIQEIINKYAAHNNLTLDGRLRGIADPYSVGYNEFSEIDRDTYKKYNELAKSDNLTRAAYMAEELLNKINSIYETLYGIRKNEMLIGGVTPSAKEENEIDLTNEKYKGYEKPKTGATISIWQKMKMLEMDLNQKTELLENSANTSEDKSKRLNREREELVKIKELIKETNGAHKDLTEQKKLLDKLSSGSLANHEIMPYIENYMRKMLETSAPVMKQAAEQSNVDIIPDITTAPVEKKETPAQEQIVPQQNETTKESPITGHKDTELTPVGGDEFFKLWYTFCSQFHPKTVELYNAPDQEKEVVFRNSLLNIFESYKRSIITSIKDTYGNSDIDTLLERYSAMLNKDNPDSLMHEEKYLEVSINAMENEIENKSGNEVIKQYSAKELDKAKKLYERGLGQYNKYVTALSVLTQGKIDRHTVQSLRKPELDNLITAVKNIPSGQLPAIFKTLGEILELKQDPEERYKAPKGDAYTYNTSLAEQAETSFTAIKSMNEEEFQAAKRGVEKSLRRYNMKEGVTTQAMGDMGSLFAGQYENLSKSFETVGSSIRTDLRALANKATATLQAEKENVFTNYRNVTNKYKEDKNISSQVQPILQQVVTKYRDTVAPVERGKGGTPFTNSKVIKEELQQAMEGAKGNLAPKAISLIENVEKVMLTLNKLMFNYNQANVNVRYPYSSEDMDSSEITPALIKGCYDDILKVGEELTVAQAKNITSNLSKLLELGNNETNKIYFNDNFGEGADKIKSRADSNLQAIKELIKRLNKFSSTRITQKLTNAATIEAAISNLTAGNFFNLKKVIQLLGYKEKTWDPITEKMRINELSERAGDLRLVPGLSDFLGDPEISGYHEAILEMASTRDSEINSISKGIIKKLEALKSHIAASLEGAEKKAEDVNINLYGEDTVSYVKHIGRLETITNKIAEIQTKLQTTQDPDPKKDKKIKDGLKKSLTKYTTEKAQLEAHVQEVQTVPAGLVELQFGAVASKILRPQETKVALALDDDLEDYNSRFELVSRRVSPEQLMMRDKNWYSLLKSWETTINQCITSIKEVRKSPIQAYASKEGKITPKRRDAGTLLGTDMTKYTLSGGEGVLKQEITKLQDEYNHDKTKVDLLDQIQSLQDIASKVSTAGKEPYTTQEKLVVDTLLEKYKPHKNEHVLRTISSLSRDILMVLTTAKPPQHDEEAEERKEFIEKISPIVFESTYLPSTYFSEQKVQDMMATTQKLAQKVLSKYNTTELSRKLNDKIITNKELSSKPAVAEGEKRNIIDSAIGPLKTISNQVEQLNTTGQYDSIVSYLQELEKDILSSKSNIREQKPVPEDYVQSIETIKKEFNNIEGVIKDIKQLESNSELTNPEISAIHKSINNLFNAPNLAQLVNEVVSAAEDTNDIKTATSILNTYIFNIQAAINLLTGENSILDSITKKTPVNLGKGPTAPKKDKSVADNDRMLSPDFRARVIVPIRDTVNKLNTLKDQLTERKDLLEMSQSTGSSTDKLADKKKQLDYKQDQLKNNVDAIQKIKNELASLQGTGDENTKRYQMLSAEEEKLTAAVARTEEEIKGISNFIQMVSEKGMPPKTVGYESIISRLRDLKEIPVTSPEQAEEVNALNAQIKQIKSIASGEFDTQRVTRDNGKPFPEGKIKNKITRGTL